ncbi:hypothetical protein GH5_01400 [Leishmania sp. Ghana 2012 LV757]|uniref:hypothetical protein n=1 Tax=Leishmania sp. Ghana 2012 LV757 TaxID=2803181 RepID=UPI001B4A6EAB|nr:hypothetical protein GH5_01400 [Leishmania sp. Ghana 2012 LV757]
MASGASVSPHLLSESVEKHCAADIYALHHRLDRCLKQVEKLTSSSAGDAAVSRYECDRAGTSCIRRLGQLLREARRLAQRVEEAAGDKASDAQATVEPVDDGVDTPLRAYYRQQLQARFAHLQQDADAAQRLLMQYLSNNPTLAHLPVSCVGTAPRILECGLTGATAASFGSTSRIYADSVPPHAAHIPPAAVYSIEGASSAAAGTQNSSVARGSVAETKKEADSKERETSAAASLSGHAMGTSAAAGPAITAEDRIMEDIQQAIHQMKDGALQMSALMEQEKSRMKSATELLSGGVAKGQANMHDLDRVSYVAEAAHVPWLLLCMPGMPILWRTVLQPMWAFVKQVLMMSFIIAVTGCVLLLISFLPKPTVYRVQRSRTHDSRVSPLQSTAASAPAPVAAPASPPPVVNASPSASYEAETHVSIEQAAPAKTVHETPPPSRAQSGPAEFSDDL